MRRVTARRRAAVKSVNARCTLGVRRSGLMTASLHPARADRGPVTQTLHGLCEPGGVCVGRVGSGGWHGA